MAQKKSFTPQTLRSILATLLVLILAGGGALFYLGITELREYSTLVNQRLADAEASGKQVDELQHLKGQLANSTTLVNKANQLFIAPGSFQSRALADVRKYANAANLSIERTSFEEDGAHTIVVRLRSPVPYDNLVMFLSNIEGNLPKLQVNSLSLHRVDGGNSSNMVRVDDIKIDVSVR